MLKDMPEELLGNALDDDALEDVAGGAGSKDGKTELDGTVDASLGNSMYQVTLEGGPTVSAHISGKLRMNYIRIVPGDRVRVEYYPDDLSRCRIIYRYSRG